MEKSGPESQMRLGPESLDSEEDELCLLVILVWVFQEKFNSFNNLTVVVTVKLVFYTILPLCIHKYLCI